ncbi:PIN domain-containing protein [Caviibacterium pharyngocola]|uniref:PIN-like domain-containing protein n=1 Tax=Caviibacterium pharyngocola TaxID=28159 RepID=A0A2M8RTS5_9PAST|nr:PIN domain-containing protein [Caviibacterium pharyngocola]PJG82282.1 hypothetical protein CVP04_09980 [Caviibacterium pharyngocola]
MHHFLIDYDNLKPVNFNKLNKENCAVWLFVGYSQAHLPVSLVSSLLDFGNRAHLIQSEKGGKNALDFVLVDEMAKISLQNAADEITIVSADTGFDIVVQKYRAESRIKRIQRVSDLNLLQTMQNTMPASKQDVSQKIVIEPDWIKFAETLVQKMDQKNLPNKITSQCNFIENSLHKFLLAHSTEQRKVICRKVAVILRQKKKLPQT